MQTVQNILLAVCLCVTTKIISQTTPVIQWEKSLGGTSSENIGGFGPRECIEQTADGGYIVTGTAYSNNGHVSGNHGVSDYWIIKLNSAGTIEWQKCLGGSLLDEAYSIQQTTDGGYIVSGITYSTNGDVTVASRGGSDYWIVKLSSTGSIEWQKRLGGSRDDYANSVQQTTDGGYIVAGTTFSSDFDVIGNHGQGDIWIVKLNGSGSIQWQKCLGGSGWDERPLIQLTADGGYIVAGETYDSNDGDVNGNHGAWDYWVVKLSSSGAIVWQKCLGGSGTEESFSIMQTTDGGYIVAGYSESNDGDVSGNHGGIDYWIVKLNSTGNIEWQKCLGGSFFETAESVRQTTDGGYIVAGYSESNDGDVSGNHGVIDYWIVKLNSTGNIEWQKCLGGSNVEGAATIQQATDEGYIVAGTSYSNNGDVSGNHGSSDIWVVKLGAAIALPLRLLSFTGILQNNATQLNWQTADEINTKAFTVERSANAISFSAIGKVNAQTSPSLTHSYHYTDNAALPGTNFYRLKMEDNDHMFTYSKVIRINHNEHNEIMITPNPAFDYTAISFILLQKQKALISIYDMTGKLVKILVNSELQAGAHDITWNVKDEKGNTVSAGVYVLQVVINGKPDTMKLVIMR